MLLALERLEVLWNTAYRSSVSLEEVHAFEANTVSGGVSYSNNGDCPEYPVETVGD